MKVYNTKEALSYLESWGIKFTVSFLYKAAAKGRFGSKLGNLVLFREDELDDIISQYKERVWLNDLKSIINYSQNGILNLMAAGMPYTRFWWRYSFDIIEVLQWLKKHRPDRYNALDAETRAIIE